jgi:hypothetical protein
MEPSKNDDNEDKLIRKDLTMPLPDGEFDNINNNDEIQNESGEDESDSSENVEDESQDESGEDESGEDESGEDESGEDESGEDESGEDESGEDESGEDESGEDESDEPEVKGEDDIVNEDDVFDFDGLDIEGAPLDANLIANADFEIGAVQQKIIKEHYEVIYPDDELIKDLIDNSGVTEDYATQLVAISHDIREQYNAIRSGSHEQFKYLHPILYDYLKQGETTYNTSWLIPIVDDQKRVFSSLLADEQLQNVFYKGGDVVINDNRQKIWTKNQSQTDFELNTKSRANLDMYTQTRAGGVTLTAPNRNLQSYAIPVLRVTSIGGYRDQTQGRKLEFRQAYGEVYRVVNKYENLVKVTKPIIGYEHVLSLAGEHLNVVGFMRMPLGYKESNGISNIKGSHVYRKFDDIPPLTEDTLKHPCIVILESSGSATVPALGSILPDTSNWVDLNQTALKSVTNFIQANQRMHPYGFNTQLLAQSNLVNEKNTSYSKLVQIISDNVSRMPIQSDSQPQPQENSHGNNNPILTHPELVKYYGKYPSNLSGLDEASSQQIWVRNQPDGGHLYDCILRYLELNRQLDNFKTPITLGDVIPEPKPSESAKTINTKTTTSTKSKSIIYTDLESQQVYIWADLLNTYLDADVYPQYLKYVDYKHAAEAQQRQSILLNTRESALKDAEHDILIAQVAFTSLIKPGEKKTTSTATITPVSPELALIAKYQELAQTQPQRAQELFRSLIETQGLLSPDEHWILFASTGTRMCCIHTKSALYGENLAPFLDPASHSMDCRWCHQQIGDVDFDDFGGYDANDQPVLRNSGNVLEQFLWEHAGDLDTNVASTEVIARSCDDAGIKSDPNKHYACQVLSELQSRGLTRLTAQNYNDAIDRYAVLATAGISNNLQIDTGNVFLKQQMITRLTEFFAKTKKSAPAKLIQTLATTSLIISYEYDRFALLLATISIIRELAKPALMDKDTDTGKDNGIILDSEVLKHAIITQMSLTHKNAKMEDVQNSITVSGKALNVNRLCLLLSQIKVNAIELLSSTPLDICAKNTKIPLSFNGGEPENLSPADYFTHQITKFYQHIRQLPEIRELYRDAIATSTAKLKDTSLPAPEPPKVTVTTGGEANIRQRAVYLSAQRRLHYQSLVQDLSSAISPHPEWYLTRQLTSMIDNNNLVGKSLYINHIISRGLHQTRQIKIKPVIELTQPQWNADVDALLTDPTIVEHLNAINQIDGELGKLRISTILPSIAKNKNPDKPVASQTQVALVPKPTTSPSQWITLAYTPTQTSTATPTLKPTVMDASQDLITRKTKYLLALLDMHLKLSPTEHDKYQTQLQNLGVLTAKSEEIRSNLQYPHLSYTIDEETQIYALKTSYFQQSQLFRLESIRSYYLCLHTLISLCKTDYTWYDPTVSSQQIKDIQLWVESINDELYEEKPRYTLDSDGSDLESEVSDSDSDSEGFDIPRAKPLQLLYGYQYVMTNVDIIKVTGSPDATTPRESVDFAVNQLFLALLTELTDYFKNEYHIKPSDGDILPQKPTLYGRNFCQFIIKYLDLINDMQTINDTTQSEMSTWFSAMMSKKVAQSRQQMTQINKEMRGIYRDQVIAGVRKAGDVAGLVNEADLPALSFGTGQPVAMLMDNDDAGNAELAPNAYDGEPEHEDENPDVLGDDVTY